MRRKRGFGFEALESRALMAVTTSLVNGTLTITGDAAADDIAVVGTENPGELTITGRNGTVVNDVENGSATISGVTGNLVVETMSGDDTLSLDNVFIAASIAITTDEGDDVVTLGAHAPVSPAVLLNIDTGAGDDQVYELNYAVFVGYAHSIRLGPGDDWATVIGASAAGGSYGRTSGLPSISVIGQAGSDSILAIGLTASLGLQIDGNQGSNSLALLNSSADSISVISANDADDEIPGSVTIYLDTNYSRMGIWVFSTGSSVLATVRQAYSGVFARRCRSA
jgi:hypothetical protein